MDDDDEEEEDDVEEHLDERMTKGLYAIPMVSMEREEEEEKELDEVMSSHTDDDAMIADITIGNSPEQLPSPLELQANAASHDPEVVADDEIEDHAVTLGLNRLISGDGNGLQQLDGNETH
mmetsp:Transcript_14012/g.21122  ORF Transcript_14012/g.21122 Transcript_14012/m.21122 type:complete len:121 (+) Transcript_14012:1-363(+)